MKISNKFIPRSKIERKARVDLCNYSNLIGSKVSFPLDVEQFCFLLWKVETEYVSIAREDDIFGKFLFQRKKILINTASSFSQGNELFTLAHEAGHVALHTSYGKQAYNQLALLKVKKDSDGIFCRVNPTNFDPLEYQANVYAAELLIPKKVLSDEFGYLGFKIDLSKKGAELLSFFGVSKKVLQIRLNTLEYEVINPWYQTPLVSN